MTEVRREPCSSCPYRRDVPSGLWAASEYEKLIPYDAPTWAQPLNAFSCHATPDFYCNGWAIVSGYDSMALRVAETRNPLRQLSGDGAFVIPEPTVPLFATHTEAAEHGLRDVEHPKDEAIEAVTRLRRKYQRFR